MILIPQVRGLVAKRRILGTLVQRDLRVRYAGSAIGYLWTILDPLAMSAIYFVVFTVIFKARHVGYQPYVLFLIVGLLAWQWFSSSLTETSRALLAESRLVRSTNLPRELWVVRVVIAKGIEFMLSLPVLAGFTAYYMIKGDAHLNLRLLYIPVALVIQFVLLTGIGLILAPITALVTDTARVVRIVLRMGFYSTPIIYGVHAAPEEPADRAVVQPDDRHPRALPRGILRPGPQLQVRLPVRRDLAGGPGHRNGRLRAARIGRAEGDLTMKPVIEAKGLGIDFYRNRRRKMSLREMVFQGRTSHNKETFSALKDVTFDVMAGEAVGLIGGNGSGKSTLLKMIAGVLLPDHGTVRVRGGVAPLIELTGGFIGELSARENVYLTAGLHGLTRRQVDERFDGIVDFAGPEVKAALDTPVPPLLLGNAGPPRVRRHHHPRRAGRARGRGARRGRQGVPGEVLRAHGGDAQRRQDAVPRLAQRRRPAPVRRARSVPQAWRPGR